jgi:hypothetical protein
MEKNSPNKLELIGIIIIYLVTSLYIISLCISLFRLGHLDIEEIITLCVALAGLSLTALFHLGIIKNYLLVGILGIFTGIIVGGVFILIGHQLEIEDDK